MGARSRPDGVGDREIAPGDWRAGYQSDLDWYADGRYLLTIQYAVGAIILLGPVLIDAATGEHIPFDLGTSSYGLRWRPGTTAARARSSH